MDETQARQWLDRLEPEDDPFANAHWDPYGHFDRESRADIHALIDRAQQDGVVHKPTGSRISYEADGEGYQTWLIDLDEPKSSEEFPLRLSAPMAFLAATDLRGTDAALDLLTDAVTAANLCTRALARYISRHRLG